MRLFLLLLPGLLFTSFAGAQSAGTEANLTFSSPPAGLTTTEGSPLTVTSDRAVTWSLQAGSLGTLQVISPTKAVFTPPSSGVRANNSIAGCPVLPNDSVYNTPIDKLPVHSSSAAWVGESHAIGAVGVTFVDPWGVNLVDNSYPVTEPTFYYTRQISGQPFQLVTGAWRKREAGSLTLDSANDHHMTSLNHQTCQFYETYQDGMGVNGTTAQSGYTYASTSYTQPSLLDGGGTTDAAGLPLLPLTLHLSEIESGSVNHALRFTSCTGCISNKFVWPATYSTGGVLSSAAAPMGSRWRLKASFNVSGFSAKAQVILKALQQYGMMLADNGMIDQIEVDSDVNLDLEAASALKEITTANLPVTDFEVVDESSLEVSVGSHQAKPGGAATVSGYAIISAKDSSGNAISVPVAVQPVLVGTPYENLIVQAGQSFALESWVNGASNTAVTWTASAGSVSPGGEYTPPASVGGPLPLTLVATSVADPTASTTIHGWVIPSGAIRIDVGSTNAYTDTKGNVWMADELGFETGAFSRQNDSYPLNGWGTTTDATIYKTYDYTWGDDIVYGPFVVPNGSYTVSFLFGRGACSGHYNVAQTFDTQLTPGPVVLEVNGVDTTFDLAAAEKSTCRTAAVGTASVTVSNNLLTVALRSTGTKTTQSAPALNGLQIVGSGTQTSNSTVTPSTPLAPGAQAQTAVALAEVAAITGKAPGSQSSSVSPTAPHAKKKFHS